ncbi:PP2C family protein-serine/threonine phosphatase [Ursidibacter sp. B-7004-1]
MWNITFCQKFGSNKQHNQDALFNGLEVFQYKLKNAETICVESEPLFLGVADGISSSPTPQRASRFIMDALSKCQGLNSQWLRSVKSELLYHCDFGSSTTFVGAEISCSGKGKILNVGDSRAYKITLSGEWKQLSVDHIMLAEMEAEGITDQNIDYASIYSMLSDYIVADFEFTDFKIHCTQFKLEKGESLLLCSDGFSDYISQSQRQEIWQKYSTNKERLNICKKILNSHRLYDDFSVVVCEMK